jgi:protein SCO1/2
MDKAGREPVHGRHWIGTGAIVVAILLLSACQPYRFRGTEYTDPQPAPDFQLVRSGEGSLKLSDLRGRVVLLFFGFTSCPDVCPTTLADAARILGGLGEDAAKTEYLFVTVDPERDTPEVLERYTAVFDPAIIGLTGSPESLAQVWADYGIFVEKVPLEGSAQDYTVTHTARVFIIDADGRLRLSYSFGTPYEDILSDLRELLSA